MLHAARKLGLQTPEVDASEGKSYNNATYQAAHTFGMLLVLHADGVAAGPHDVRCAFRHQAPACVEGALVGPCL